MAEFVKPPNLVFLSPELASLAWDTRAGPSIVLVATALFGVGLAVGTVVRGRV